jgi:phospholipid/cholesterol/gamma-HCH transport system ATP-binding protein
MASNGSILDVARARPVTEPDEAPPPLYDLRLAPGDLALVDAPDVAQARDFADLCCGLVPLAEGSVRFLGHEWTKLPLDYAAALRGRIGRVFAAGGWLPFLDAAANILLPQLHHTRHDERALRDRATELACAFGLPGLPLGRAGDLSEQDLASAACVRAFLGEPALLLLESPVGGKYADLKTALHEAIAEARGRGAAAVWLCRSELVWRDRAFPATARFRLAESGLVPVGRAP